MLKCRLLYLKGRQRRLMVLVIWGKFVKIYYDYQSTYQLPSSIGIHRVRDATHLS